MFAFIKFSHIAHTNAEAIYQQPSPQQGRQGQGRGGTPQNVGKPSQSGKHLPTFEFAIQPQSMQECNTAGTNAVVLRHHQQQKQQHDRFYADQLQYSQADYQRHQNQQDLEFTFQLPLDPYLICPNCKKQFREGQLPEYRHHIDSCRL